MSFGNGTKGGKGTTGTSEYFTALVDNSRYYTVSHSNKRYITGANGISWY